jgi:hypothetical protein
VTDVELLLNARSMLATNSPDSHSGADRLGEISALLAAGLLRLRSRKSSPNLPALGDVSLDCEGNSTGDVVAEVEVSRP